MATDAAAPPAWPGLTGLREVFGHGPPPVSAAYGRRALLAVRWIALLGGALLHLVLGLWWSWPGGLVSAGVFAVYAATVAPLVTHRWPSRTTLHLVIDGIVVSIAAGVAGSPALALPWLFALFLAPMIFTGTRAALGVLTAAAFLVPAAFAAVATGGVRSLPPLPNDLQVIYMYVAFAGDVVIAVFLTLAMGAATRANEAERRRSARALERQRGHLEALFAAIPTPVAQFDMAEIADRLTALRRRGVDDPAGYLDEHPPLATTLVDMIVAERANPAWARLFGLTSEQVLGRVRSERLPVSVADAFRRLISELAAGNSSGGFRLGFETFEGRAIRGWFGFHVVGAPDDPDYSRVIVTAVDETERENLLCEINERNDELRRALEELQAAQAEMLQGQKMEAIGALASGIAHEINTPIQYVGDNVRFIGDASNDILAVLQASGQAVAEYQDESLRPETMAMLAAALDDADVEFLFEELPAAVEQALEGVDRVAAIVRAMKDFAHPGSDELAPVDINHAIATTVTVSKNEWKYVADLETDLDPAVGMVPALSGPLNQVILNLIVNAAHAIEDKGGEGKGLIRITTARDDVYAVISVSDTGCGIPAEIRDRIFEPFYTTKDVGRGSGQGLAIAHQVIVDRHRGRIDVESEVGVGTTFHLRIPLHPEEED